MTNDGLCSDGRVAVLTGAGGGLAARGAKVVVDVTGPPAHG